MTTTLDGVVYYDSGMGSSDPHEYHDTIEGDPHRNRGSDTCRQVCLNDLAAYLRVYNTDSLGVRIVLDGPKKDLITFTRRGKSWKPEPFASIMDGFPISARVKGFGHVYIGWSPRGHRET